MFKVSVVIPTIGTRASINLLIDSLSCQSVSLETIIIVVPETNKDVFLSIFKRSCDLVTVLFSPYSGQVRQRIHGFKNCANGLVLQLDDDLSIPSPNFVEKLVDNFENIQSQLGTTKISIGPLIVPSELSIATKFKCFMSRFLHTIPRPKISIFGGGSYPRFLLNQKLPSSLEYVEAEWLPGGVLLSHLSAVNLTNYFPFKGRAEAEDIIDSIKKNQNGVRLFLCLDLQIEISDSSPIIATDEFIKQCKIAIFINKKLGKILFCAPIIKYFFKRLFYDLGKYFRRIG